MEHIYQTSSLNNICCCLVGVVWTSTVGKFTNDGRLPPLNKGKNPTPDLTTSLFDMASCTKVVATTSAVALLYQMNLLPLQTRVTDVLGQRFGTQGKQDITVLNLLLHNAGFPPDPTPTNYWAPSFGCDGPAPVPMPLPSHCATHALAALFNQTLATPVGAQYVYSDISFLSLMWVVGAVVKEHQLVTPSQWSSVPGVCPRQGASFANQLQCYYEAFLREYFWKPLKMHSTQFLPSPQQAPFCLPTVIPSQENDTLVLQGPVNDGNAYMLGGIAGHAGLFTTAKDMATFLQGYISMYSSFPLTKATRTLFTREYNHTQSSRALGWNTNDPAVLDEGWDQSCGDLMSASTFMHIGYTGTMLCVDPDRQIYTILLTNRVYPSDLNIQIREVRREFGDAVVRALNNGAKAKAMAKNAMQKQFHAGN